jgi:sugar-specific transcriptional regulator TrmB
MNGVIEKLKRVGLTEYEAKAYLALARTHLSTATQVSDKSGIPRTKTYETLESLAQKGWVRVMSGVPLLFKAVDPMSVFERVKEDYTKFLDAFQLTLTEKVNNSMCEKFVIKRFDIGLDGLKEEIKKAKTVAINNATVDFIKKANNAFKPDAKIRVLMFPG